MSSALDKINNGDLDIGSGVISATSVTCWKQVEDMTRQ